MAHDSKNIMVVLSSPSGVGKTTITKKFNKKYNSFKLSVSYTTRPPRSNEVDGVDYHFVSKKVFEDLINNKEFYEYAKIFDNYYGTLKKGVDEVILKNDLIFDIDWQGTKQLSKFKTLNLLKIYLIPSNKEELKKISKQNQNTIDEIEERFNAFDDDIKHWNDYDYIINNENLETCFKQIEDIILSKKKNYFFSNNSVIL